MLMYHCIARRSNGGVSSGNNFPLRGEKHSNWEGGLRTAAFVSGGYVPEAVRGTNNTVNMHVADWYATFADVAGVDPTDDPPVAPRAGDPSAPYTNIYGEDSFPPADSRSVWAAIARPHDGNNSAPDAVHDALVLSKEVIVAGKWKLLVAQPNFKSQNNGWKGSDGKWVAPSKAETFDCTQQTLAPADSFFPVPAKPGLSPCLFDLRADPAERHDVSAANADVVQRLWAALNATILTQRDCQGWSYKGVKAPGAGIPGPAQPGGGTSCSPPALLGSCDTACAQKKWNAYGNKGGPVCGVPGCNGGDEEREAVLRRQRAEAAVVSEGK